MILAFSQSINSFLQCHQLFQLNADHRKMFNRKTFWCCCCWINNAFAPVVFLVVDHRVDPITVRWKIGKMLIV